MSFEPAALESALAAAVGDDPTLVAELRTAFLDSAIRHFEAMKRAVTEPDWREAALRLKGLAASFGASRLIELADEAVAGRRADSTALADIERALAVLRVQ
jgi:HPt (histidine-containing phosphotransfer) domain-containing protein